MTRSEYFRFRTGTSGLTDDELLILDRLFDGIWYPPYVLYDEHFASYANLPFSHGLSDKAVHALLARWIKAGWLTYEESEEEQGGPYFSLTVLGGVQWEQERKPPWDRYCQDWYYSAGSGPWCRRRKPTQGLVTITSPSRRTAEAFYRRYIRGRLFDGKVISRSRTIRRVSGLSTLVVWKKFPPVFEIHGALREADSDGNTWNLNQKEICWWRDVSELVELRLKGIA